MRRRGAHSSGSSGSPGSTPARRRGTIAAACALALLGGCASAPDVRMLATGRSDATAYQLDGSDLETLRREAGRLCPLGGDVVRQSSQGAPPPAPAESTWQRALQATAQWADSPPRSAQMLVVCRESGDRMRLTPAAPTAATQPSAAPRATTTAEPAAAPEVAAALPVGPVMPTW